MVSFNFISVYFFIFALSNWQHLRFCFDLVFHLSLLMLSFRFIKLSFAQLSLRCFSSRRPILSSSFVFFFLLFLSVHLLTLLWLLLLIYSMTFCSMLLCGVSHLNSILLSYCTYPTSLESSREEGHLTEFLVCIKYSASCSQLGSTT